MPKRNNLDISQKKYVGVTYKTRYKLHSRFSNDRHDITVTERDHDEYSNFFSSSVISHIAMQFLIKANKKIQILDAGCGKGCAANSILNSELRHKVEKITGISKDYYTSVKYVLGHHPDNFKFYHGNVLDVLQAERLSVDLIYDVWGAYSYTLSKIDLLRLYYQSLAQNGVAYVVDGPARGYANKTKIKFPNEVRPTLLFDTLCTRFPQHFEFAGDYSIKMTKVTSRFPLQTEFQHSFKRMRSVKHRVISEKEAEKGCAAFHADVMITQVPEQKRSDYNLRLV